jgi:hypothetical protein
MRIYVHRAYESFDRFDLFRIFCQTRSTDITDVVCFSPYTTKYFHGRNGLYFRYSKTYLDRYFHRFL